MRDEYIRDKRANSENESVFLTITFWPFLLIIILFICIPKRIIESLIKNIDEELK